MYKIIAVVLCFALGATPTVAHAGDTAGTATSAHTILEEVTVTGGATAIRSLPGSASIVGIDQIQRYDATDISDLLSEVPGVYLRYEDGYGLRPNIGIRGAASERSQKITLMEDGILIAPSPYSAPSAYYFPNVNRMSAVEIFKGPAAIHYGPQTVGGALNMITRPLPVRLISEIDATYGTDNYQKIAATHGNSFTNAAYQIEALRFSADGFKELDNGTDTGFSRNDANVKFLLRTDADAKVYQQLQMKLGYADEDSNETYLGLSDADFAANPVRRYSASQRDAFTSSHKQLHVIHTADFRNGIELTSKAYANRFARSWNKFSGFIDGADIDDVLAQPLLYERQMALLRGDANSDGSDAELIELANTARDHGAYGVELAGRMSLARGEWLHTLEAGLRYHEDYEKRDHTFGGYLMRDGELLFDGNDSRPRTALRKASSDALAFFLSDEIDFRKLKLSLGLRVEDIHGKIDNYLNGSVSRNSQQAVIPGAGAYYQMTDHIGVLLGVNEGFSPTGPATSGVEPEESVNVEYGMRYRRGPLVADAVGFYSDYSNLIGRCRVSDAGCNVGDAFNGGAVKISGLETNARYTLPLAHGIHVPVSLTYTFTESEFQSTFQSSFSQWGNVVDGDELPYTPRHQARAQIGLRDALWSVDLAIKYVSEMREAPGRGAYDSTPFTPAYTTVDLAGSYIFADRLELRLIGENLADKQVVVSRRPLGARPNQPRSLRLAARYKF